MENCRDSNSATIRLMTTSVPISSFLKEDKVDFKILKHGYITEKISNKPSIKDISKNIGAAMHGINIDDLPEEDKLSKRGW